MYTLVVIDVQQQFLFAAMPVLSVIRRRVLKARREGAAILYVEYDGCGNTVSDVYLNNYRRTHTVLKYEDAGGPQVSSYVLKYQLPKRLVVCGVNTNYCVRRTVEGLTGFSVQVARAACNDGYGHQLQGLHAMLDMPHVEIVR